MNELVKTLAATGLLLASGAQAAIVNLAANLDSNSEPFDIQPTQGSGSAAATLDSETGEFAWLISFQDLTGPVTIAHFHEGAAGTSGPVAIALDAVDVVTISGIGETEGVFQGNAILNSDQMSAVLSGLWYANLHTELNPAGEIRGQLFEVDGFAVSPVPVPATVWLLGTGLIGLAAVARGYSAV